MLERAFIASLALGLLATSSLVGQQAKPPSGQAAGVLQIYEHMTQVGTVAARTFRDSAGRVAKVIYYTSSGVREPSQERDLRPQLTDVYSYDAKGQLSTTERVNHDGTLLSVRHDEYGSGGQRIRTWSTNGDGIETLETRYNPTGSSTITELHFDTTGQYVVGIRGVIPPDADLPHGWGEPVNGLACGIVLTREHGPLDDIQLSLNIQSNQPWPKLASGSLPDTHMVLQRGPSGDCDSRVGGASPD